MKKSDHDKLVARFIGGDDPEAAEALIRVHYQRVLQWCRELTRDEPAAEDLTQETFLRVLEQRLIWDRTRPFIASVRAIANACYDEWRHSEWACRPRSLDALRTLSTAVAPNPEERLFREEELRDTRRNVRCLLEFETWARRHMPTWSLSRCLIARWRGVSWHAAAREYGFSSAWKAEQAIAHTMTQVLSGSPEACEDFKRWLRRCDNDALSQERLKRLGIVDVDTLSVCDVA